MTTFYVVATPIGNLEDMTVRAVNVLSNVDLILAEDTRVTRTLLERYNIRKEVVSYHQHSTLRKVEWILDQLRRGKNVALVSDAGTPGISDPGGLLVEKIVAELPDVRIVPIPGANAAVAALSASGFPADSFTFLGFPPHKKGRQTFFAKLGDIDHAIVFYESKHRIVKALEQMKALSRIEKRPVMVARELTKQFETIYRGPIDDIIMRLKGKESLGEFVVVVGPRVKSSSSS